MLGMLGKLVGMDGEGDGALPPGSLWKSVFRVGSVWLMRRMTQHWSTPGQRHRTGQRLVNNLVLVHTGCLGTALESNRVVIQMSCLQP